LPISRLTDGAGALAVLHGEAEVLEVAPGVPLVVVGAVVSGRTAGGAGPARAAALVEGGVRALVVALHVDAELGHGSALNNTTTHNGTAVARAF